MPKLIFSNQYFSKLVDHYLEISDHNKKGLTYDQIEFLLLLVNEDLLIKNIVLGKELV